jgi:hypothetical protein
VSQFHFSVGLQGWFGAKVCFEATYSSKDLIVIEVTCLFDFKE